MKKTTLFNLLSAVVLILTAYSGVVPAIAASWFGVIIFAVTGFLNTTYTTSGVWIADSWKISQWVISIGGVLLSIGNLLSENQLVPQNILNYVLIGVTVAIQFFGKQFPKTVA